MTILVDPAVWRWRGRHWAHLVSDHSYEELHAFAALLGVPRRAFQGDHYDVPAELREQALSMGASAVPARELLLRLRAAGLRRPRRRRTGPNNPWLDDPEIARGEDYQRLLDRQAARSTNPHGEADLVASLLAGREAASVLDAGCGTGRVAIELDRRGFDVVGVDLDPANLAVARRLAPDIAWCEADLAELDLGRRFDLAVAAGNVLLFLTPGTSAEVVASLAGHLHTGGLLVAGFQLRSGGPGIRSYDAWCAAAGLRLMERWSSWHGDRDAEDYQVSVHVRADADGQKASP